MLYQQSAMGHEGRRRTASEAAHHEFVAHLGGQLSALGLDFWRRLKVVEAMLVKLPRSLRVFIGLLLVLTHVALQPGKALSLVLCTEQDGRTIVEVAASGSCQHPAAIHEDGFAEFAAPCCEGCTDRLLPADPTRTVSSKRGEAPQTILPTGPPGEDTALTSLFAYFVEEAHLPHGEYSSFYINTDDPRLGLLRSTRLLI